MTPDNLTDEIPLLNEMWVPDSGPPEENRIAPRETEMSDAGETELRGSESLGRCTPPLPFRYINK